MADQMFLIRKRGLYYRPNSQGYTSNTAEAGRYTKQEAERITHPNGQTGSRDGMDYVPAPENSDPRDEVIRQLVEAASALLAEAHRNMRGGKGHLLDNMDAALAAARKLMGEDNG